jgi:hypothetical protein
LANLFLVMMEGPYRNGSDWQSHRRDGHSDRDGASFYLRRDLGGRYQLELHRTPVDLMERRVRLVGTLVGPDLVNADGVAPG